jgi:hypothetical protein
MGNCAAQPREPAAAIQQTSVEGDRFCKPGKKLSARCYAARVPRSMANIFPIAKDFLLYQQNFPS